MHTHVQIIHHPDHQDAVIMLQVHLFWTSHAWTVMAAGPVMSNGQSSWQTGGQANQTIKKLT